MGTLTLAFTSTHLLIMLHMLLWKPLLNPYVGYTNLLYPDIPRKLQKAVYPNSKLVSLNLRSYVWTLWYLSSHGVLSYWWSLKPIWLPLFFHPRFLHSSSVSSLLGQCKTYLWRIQDSLHRLRSSLHLWATLRCWVSGSELCLKERCSSLPYPLWGWPLPYFKVKQLQFNTSIPNHPETCCRIYTASPKMGGN